MSIILYCRNYAKVKLAILLC